MVGISGIGSGIDIDSIVGALVNAQKAPKEAQLARLEKATTSKFSALGQLKGALSELQTAMKSLNDLSLFEKRTATSSDATRLTVSSSNEALAGSYDVAIKRLASSSKVASEAIASGGSATFNEGQLTISLAGQSLAEVDVAQGATLVEVRDAINAKTASQGVTANIISDPDSGNARLVLSSSETGDNQFVTIEATASTGTGADFDLSKLNISDSVAALINDVSDPGYGGAGFITEPGNAEIEIDGILVRPSSNSVSDAITGVTLNLLQAEEGQTVKVTVGLDNASVATSVKKFVDAYNKLLTTTNQLTAVVQVGEGEAPVAGGLVGDASVRSLLSSVRNELVAAADQDGVRILADLGVTTQKDGTLKIDESKLSAAVAENFDSVASFFTGDKGLMNRLDARIDGYIKSGGILEQRMDGLQSTLKSVDEQKETLNLRIQQVQTRLYAQFNAMDALVGQLNQTSERLTQSLASLPGFVKKDS